MAKARLVYWETTVFVSHFQREEGRSLYTLPVLEDAARGNIRILTSTLTRAEMVKDARQEPMSDEERTKLDRLFEHSYITMIPVDRYIASLASKLAGRFGLKPADATHLATAVRMDAEVFQTWDEADFMKDKVLTNPPVLFETPRRPGGIQLEMDLSDRAAAG